MIAAFVPVDIQAEGRHLFVAPDAQSIRLRNPSLLKQAEMNLGVS